MFPGSRLSKLLEAIPALQTQQEWMPPERAPWLAEGKLDVERLFERLLFPFMERCIRLGEREIVAQLCSFLDKLVTDSADERLVNQVRKRASQVFPDIAPQVRYPRSNHIWVTDQPSLLDSTNLELVRSALETSKVIFGFHAYYYGGSAGDWWAASNLSDYLRLVDAARPGDLFWVHALDQLVQAGYVLASVQVGPDERLSSSLLGAEALVQMAAHIGTDDSVIFVWWTQAAAGGGRVCGIRELMEDFQEELDAEFARLDPSPGALYAFRFADLGKPETFLLKAKRPNAAGEVPIGGAY